MKVLGISFGRKLGNSEILVKQALKQAEKRGNEVEFIRVMDMDIKPCAGCMACVINLLGGGNGKCVIKDDFHILQEAIFESDAIIVCAPVYVWAPSGLFKCVCDRMGPAADIAFRTHARDLGEKLGKSEDQMVDKRAFKKRPAAYITVGGAMTKNWTSLGISQMYEFGSMGLNVVDAVGVYKGMQYKHILGDEEIMERMTAVGDHIADALENEECMDKWYGDEEGVCPVCHMDLLTVIPGGNKVECPICGIEGTLTVEDGKICTHFSEEQQARSRLFMAGKIEHRDEIAWGAMNSKEVPDMAARLKEFGEYCK